MITDDDADITDAQICELKDRLFESAIGGAELEAELRACSCALGDPSYREDDRPAARVHCAQIINARAAACSCGHPRESHDLDDTCVSCDCRAFNARATGKHWPDCAVSHGGNACDMGPECGTDDAASKAGAK